MAFSNESITFGAVGLQGENVNNPTAIAFSQAGTPVLFVTQQNGEIWRFEIERQADGADADTLPEFIVTASTKISTIKFDTQNHNDDGAINATAARQTTGMVTTTDADGNDVLYVNSSDWRIAVGNDSGLDTNSGQIHRITLDKTTGEVLDSVAVVRGLPRSEENHSTNGMDLSVDPDTGDVILWIAQGGNTNDGAPSNNFAGTMEYALAGTVMKVNLTQLDAYDVRVDGHGDRFILDLPTLNDPTRPDIDLSTLNIQNLADDPNFALDDNGIGSNGELNPDWAGGNNGLNMAKLSAKVMVSEGGELKLVDNPLAIHSPGYRNPYDVLVTEGGEVFTWDNGPNGGWGGQPSPFVDNTTDSGNNWVEDWTRELATNQFNESGSTGFGDQLHYAGATTDAYGPYGGHAAPLRAAQDIFSAAFNSDGSYRPASSSDPVLDMNGDVIFPDEATARNYLAQLFIIWEETSDGVWENVTPALPADLHDLLSGYQWAHPGSSIGDPTAHFDGQSLMNGTYYSPESQLFPVGTDGSLRTVNASTNGLSEYTATFFGGELKGAVIAASFNGSLYFEKPIDTDGDGRPDAVDSLGTISGFGSQPLAVTSLGDEGIPGVLIDTDGDGVDDFAGMIVSATYGADNITFFVPGGTPADPNNDLDLDGIDNIKDSHVGDPLDGQGVIVGGGDTAYWGFELSNSAATPPGAIPDGDSIAGDIGVNAVWRNGVDAQIAPAGEPALYNPGNWNLGGASSFVSIDRASTGAAEGTANSQADVLGIGFAAPSGIGAIKISTEMVNAFSYTLNTDAPKTWDGGEKFGLMVGPGHQTTFVEATIAAVDDSGTLRFGLQLLVEEGDAYVTDFIEIPGIESPIRDATDPNIQLEIDLDMTPAAESVVARARYLNDNAYTSWFETGSLDLPGAVADAVRGQYSNYGEQTGAVVGMVSSAAAGDDSFAASWDWIQVDGTEGAAASGEVLMRWNAGPKDVAAIDGGMAWVTTGATIVGAASVATAKAAENGLNTSVPQDTTPVGLYTHELYGSSAGSPFGLEFGGGALASGYYAVRLFMGNGYSGTSEAGQRVFDVSIEDGLFLDNVDLSALFGHKVGGMFEWVGRVEDGTIDIDFAHAVENPLINGVEIIRISDSGPVISIVDETVNEADGTVLVTIQSDVAVPLDSSVTVTYEIVPGSASADLDYVAPDLTYDAATGIYSGSGTIAGGSADLTIPIEIVSDTLIEGNEAFQVRITGVAGANAAVGDGSATITIVDDDTTTSDPGTVLFRINAGGVEVAATDGGPAWAEDRAGADGTANGTATNGTPSPYLVDRGLASDDTTYGYSGAGGINGTDAPDGLFTTERYSALANPNNISYAFGVANGDYHVTLYFDELYFSAAGKRLFDVALEGDVVLDDFDTFAAFGNDSGQRSFNVSVQDGELNLDFLKGLANNPHVAAIEVAAAGSGTGSSAQLSVADASVNEGDGTASVVFTLDAAVSEGPVTVAYSLGGTATVGADYVAPSVHEVTFAAGETTATATFDITDDTDVEGTETITLTVDGISAPSDALVTAADGSGTVTISDNDTVAPPADGEIVLRWNAGKKDVAPVDDGPDWLKTGVTVVGSAAIATAKAAENGLDASVPQDTAPVGLYTHELWWGVSGTPGLEFGGGGLASGSYVVRLFMGNGYSGTSQVGDRVFDVSIEDSLFLDDLDLVSTFGHKVGGMFEWTGEITDGTLDIDFAHIKDNPLINGVEVIKLADGGGTAPSYDDYALGANVGDFSDAMAAPTLVSLAAGSNQVVATQQGDPDRDYDYVTVNVPTDHVLTGVTLSDYDDYDTSLVNATFLGMQAGTVFTESPDAPDPATMLGGVVYDELDIGGDLLADMADGVIEGYDANTLGFSTPLGAGDYTLWFSQNGTPTTSTLNFAVEAASGGTTPTGGEATFQVLKFQDDVQASNYANNSFRITNTGTKKIIGVEVDVTAALYPDTVFDPYGEAGDTTSKALTINTDDGTGVVAPSAASYIGAGGVDGYEKIVLSFDSAVDGGFENGEVLGFSVDMDPNSVAGADADTLNSGAIPTWDVGGVSGAELIGSTVTVTFDDGTTASGQLHGTNTQGGGHGLASQDSPHVAVDLSVNGLTGGGVGSYGSSGPTVIVQGPAGETARVVLTKGFIQPVENNFTGDYAARLDAQLAALAAQGFPANNAVEFQTVDVDLTGADQDISSLFDFSGVAGYDFVGEDQVPLGFVAGVIDTARGDLPIGPLTQPIYLGYDAGSTLTLSVASAGDAVESGDAGTTDVLFTVGASDPAFVGDVTVSYQVAVTDGSGATTTGEETTILTFDGTTAPTLSVPVANDDVDDGSETVEITLLTADAADVSATPATAIVTEDDVAAGTGDVLYRVNAGGRDVAAADGSTPEWDIDTGWAPSPFVTGGKVARTDVTVDTTGADPAADVNSLFTSERYGAMQWDFAVADGDYSVKLSFAEVFGRAPGERVFDVDIEGVTVLDDYDIAAEVGQGVAVEQTFTVSVTDGILDIDFTNVLDNAKISAIEVAESPLI